MIMLPEGFDSIFRYINVVSQRAEQLITGAKVRSETRHIKPTLQAKDDVDQDLVSWRVLTQEELDAQRQAIVDQFRAEVGADEYAASREGRIPDVLPTSEAAPEKPAVVREVEEEDQERDQELERLQRLLGLGGGAQEEETDSEAETDFSPDDSDEFDPEEAGEDLALDVDDSNSFDEFGTDEDE